MIELRGIETSRAEPAKDDPDSQYVILSDQQIELKPGDEILLLVERPPDLKHEEYGIPLRITNNDEPEEDEFIVRYGDKTFVAQKIPEFI